MKSQHKWLGEMMTVHTVAVAFLGAAAFFSVLGSAFFAAGAAAAAGFASFFASFTVPEGPRQHVSHVRGVHVCHDVLTV
jgi:hypothetical protein